MGPLGVPETIFIFILALVLFGPKKLPELGRTFGKALMEFRRASSELKSTFDREMRQIEQETRSVKDEAQKYTNDIYNYDSYYDAYSNGQESHETAAPGSNGDVSHTESTASEPEPAASAAPDSTVDANSHSHDTHSSPSGDPTEQQPVA